MVGIRVGGVGQGLRQERGIDRDGIFTDTKRPLKEGAGMAGFVGLKCGRAG